MGKDKQNYSDAIKYISLECGKHSPVRYSTDKASKQNPATSPPVPA